MLAERGVQPVEPEGDGEHEVGEHDVRQPRGRHGLHLVCRVGVRARDRIRARVWVGVGARVRVGVGVNEAGAACGPAWAL